MMNAVFDTNIVIDLLAAYPPALLEIHLYSQIAISRVTWMEVLIGASDAATQHQWENFLAQFQILEIDERVSHEAVSLRRQSRMKLPDAIILASARLSGALLVTRNTRDFAPGLTGVRIPYSR